MSANEEQPVRRAAAWGLIVLGWIWVVLAGGCTILFFGASALSLIQGRGGQEAAWAAPIMVLSVIIGGAGILIGWLMLDAERALRRGRRRVFVGWLLVAIGGLWSAQGALGLVATLALLSTGRGLGAAVPALVNLAPAATILAAGVLILRRQPKRD
jgi:hypothetical protein